MKKSNEPTEYLEEKAKTNLSQYLIAKTKLSPQVSNYICEDKESVMRNTYQMKNTGHFRSESLSKATLNVRVEMGDDVKRLREEGYSTVIKNERNLTNKRDEVINVFN